jgi:hypothetical protein
MRTHDLLMTITCLTATVCGASHLRAGARADERARDADQVCAIDGSVYKVGTVNPENVCQTCAPSDPTAWSPASEGMSCSDNHTCHRGRCWRVLQPLDRYNRMVITLLDGMAQRRR